MSTFIHLIADYGKSDPAFSEVVHRLKAEDPDIQVHTTAVPPLSTVATGFWIEQLGLHNPAFEGLFIYSNTAPRTEDATPQHADEGGQLCYLTLETEVPVVAVDAGYNLSFVRDNIQEFWEIETPATGTQFRSRDHFPKQVVELANENRNALGNLRSSEDVPPKPAATICHVDGYGRSLSETPFPRLRKALSECFPAQQAAMIRTWNSSCEAGQQQRLSINHGWETPSRYRSEPIPNILAGVAD